MMSGSALWANRRVGNHADLHHFSWDGAMWTPPTDSGVGDGRFDLGMLDIWA